MLVLHLRPFFFLPFRFPSSLCSYPLRLLLLLLLLVYRCFHLVSAVKGICCSHKQRTELVMMLHMLGSRRLFPFLEPTAPTHTLDRCFSPPLLFFLLHCLSIPALLLTQHLCATHVNLPLAHVNEAPQSSSTPPHSQASRPPTLCKCNCPSLPFMQLTCAPMVHDLNNFHSWVQGHLKITGSAQQGIPGVLESGPQRPSS